MSEADKIFEKLGFEKEERAGVLFYTQKIKGENYAERTIVINTYDPSFQGIFSEKNIDGKYMEHFPLCILPKELQALNKKVEELGWN